MHEIDPQSETRMRQALQRLGAASPLGAPPEIGTRLAETFRRHHAQRRRIRRAGMALAAVIVLGLAWLALPRAAQRPAGNAAQHQIGERKNAPVASAAEQKPAPAPPSTVKAEVKQAAATASSQRKRAGTATTTSARASDFLALPGYDPAVPLDELQVVRVQLPANALWKMGAPISAEAGERQVTADFVMNQDGTPYAVRLVQ